LSHLSYLFGLEPIGIKFGLENIRALLDSLGHPERAYATVHVAGTNGKGSVTAMVDAALRAGGRRSARYTSPHLVDIRERFVIDGRPVGAEALDAAIADLRRHIDTLRAGGVLDVQPTFFEVTTAIAFELFRRAGVDIAVIEVGLGGRLDATNVVAPAATAITSIAFDHQKYLGDTLREIAAEKAGIIKRGVPVVVGRMEPEAAAVIERIARERGAPVIHAWGGVEMVRLPASSAGAGPVPSPAEGKRSRPRSQARARGRKLAPAVASSRAQAGTAGHRSDATGGEELRLRTPAHDYGTIALSLPGAHQIDNAVVAVRLLEILEVPRAAIVDGLTRVEWPGRLEVRRVGDGCEALLDAAHNPAGAAALASYLKDHRAGRMPLVFGAMRDKDVDGMFRVLLPAVSALVATRASNARAADPLVLADRARAIAAELPVMVEPLPGDAVAAAWRLSPRIIVAGSIFLLGDVMRELDR
jgi:dihydrofolate synthase/folylpolyglutamate synthase